MTDVRSVELVIARRDALFLVAVGGGLENPGSCWKSVDVVERCRRDRDEPEGGGEEKDSVVHLHAQAEAPVGEVSLSGTGCQAAQRAGEVLSYPLPNVGPTRAWRLLAFRSRAVHLLLLYARGMIPHIFSGHARLASTRRFCGDPFGRRRLASRPVPVAGRTGGMRVVVAWGRQNKTHTHMCLRA